MKGGIMTEPFRKFIRISLWTVVAIFSVRCFFNHEALAAAVNKADWVSLVYSIFCYAGEAIAITAIIMAVFEKIGWKLKPINKLTGSMPILAHHYTGKIVSAFDFKERDADLIVKQSFLDISVVLKTGESRSTSLIASIIHIKEDPELIYHYINEPRADLKSGSPMHYGTAVLKIRDPEVIDGNYYTDRKTKGNMHFSKKS